MYNYSTLIKLLFLSIRVESCRLFAAVKPYTFLVSWAMKDLGKLFYKRDYLERGNLALWRHWYGLGLCGSSDLKLGEFSVWFLLEEEAELAQDGPVVFFQ